MRFRVYRAVSQIPLMFAVVILTGGSTLFLKPVTPPPPEFHDRDLSGCYWLGESAEEGRIWILQEEEDNPNIITGQGVGLLFGAEEFEPWNFSGEVLGSGPPPLQGFGAIYPNPVDAENVLRAPLVFSREQVSDTEDVLNIGRPDGVGLRLERCP